MPDAGTLLPRARGGVRASRYGLSLTPWIHTLDPIACVLDHPSDNLCMHIPRYMALARNEGQRVTFESLAAAGGAAPFADVRRPQLHRDETRRYSRHEATRQVLISGGSGGKNAAKGYDRP